MVPKNLTTEQKANQRDVCLDLLDRLEREPEFLSRVITGHESWILEYDPETKRQSWEWHIANSPRPKKARMSKSKIKSIFFFTVRGSSTRNLCHQDKLSIKLFTGKSLKDSGKWWHVRPGIARTWMLHHDNVTRQSPSINFWQKKSFPVVPQPPIRRICLYYFFFFPRDKNHL